MGIPTDGASSAPEPIEGTQPGKDMTHLQAHVAFFDRDKDGVIWPRDTYQGFREIGFGVILAALSAFIIHTGFSWITYDTWFPDLFFRLKTRNMHRAKHGSDSESYTSTGEFDSRRFNAMFEMYSSPPHKDISFKEGVRMVYGNRDSFDLFGWFAATFEWLSTYLMLWPQNGRMKKEDVRAVYDGSIFYKLSGRKME